MIFRLRIVRHLTNLLVSASLLWSLLVQIGLLVLFEPIKTLKERNISSGSGVLLVLQYLM